MRAQKDTRGCDKGVQWHIQKIAVQKSGLVQVEEEDKRVHKEMMYIHYFTNYCTKLLFLRKLAACDDRDAVWGHDARVWIGRRVVGIHTR